ncbi:MAG: hypothetical protein ACRD5H_02225 [Nitrososphaerales archaeon]
MVSTVAQLAADAKLNFRHEECWQIFTSHIKPQIEELISSYYADWQRIERDITAIYMKRRGMFTAGFIVTRIDGNDPDPSMVDIEKFRIVKRMMFSRKLSYLKRKKIISKPIYDLLSNLAKRRNKIHEYAEVLSDNDRQLFNYGYRLLHATFTARCFEAEKDHMKYQIQLNDKSAIELLKLIHARVI